MATDEEPQDWKTAIDFNNLQFGIQVLRMCPDLDFPAEWVDNLWPDWLQNLEDVLDGELPFWRFEQYTPDYGTPKNWVDRPRACLLRPGEDDQFTEYSEMVDNILFEYGFIQYAAPDELDDLVDELQDFREAFSDKELKHFQKEYLRKMCYYNIGVGINQALFRLGGLREKLAQIAGVLEAILEDDMGDLVWPGENRIEWRR